jgi:hypothetical protein
MAAVGAAVAAAGIRPSAKERDWLPGQRAARSDVGQVLRLSGMLIIAKLSRETESLR